MTNQYVHDISQLDDIESIHYYEAEKAKGTSDDAIWRAINAKGRDNARTPMQWNSSQNAGFTRKDVTPWYNINPNHVTINAENRLQYAKCTFYTYQKLIQLRKDCPLIVWGDYHLLDTDENIFAYTRSYEEETWLICANFSSQNQTISQPYTAEKTIIANYAHDYDKLNSLTLLPYETFVVQVK